MGPLQPLLLPRALHGGPMLRFVLTLSLPLGLRPRTDQTIGPTTHLPRPHPSPRFLHMSYTEGNAPVPGVTDLE